MQILLHPQLHRCNVHKGDSFQIELFLVFLEQNVFIVRYKITPYFILKKKDTFKIVSPVETVIVSLL